MLTDFQNSFTDRLSGKSATSIYLNIPPHLKYVATLGLHCEWSKNHNAQELTEANCHLSTQKTVLKYLSSKIFIS